MMIKRIFAGSIVALLLSMTSLAAACDVSCAFASMSSDCHSQQTESQDSPPDGMTMDGMARDGMTMPEMAGGEDQQSVAAVQGSTASHPVIGEMGPCEKQACYDGFAVSAKTARFVDSQLHSITAISESPRADIAPPFFHDARDDIAHYRPSDGSPLLLSLRI
jgi:hypothetical protein